MTNRESSVGPVSSSHPTTAPKSRTASFPRSLACPPKDTAQSILGNLFKAGFQGVQVERVEIWQRGVRNVSDLLSAFVS